MAKLNDTRIRGTLTVNGDLVIKEKSVLDIAYPINSTFITNQYETSPNHILPFEANWELTHCQLKNQVSTKGSSDVNGLLSSTDYLKEVDVRYIFSGDIYYLRFEVLTAKEIQGGQVIANFKWYNNSDSNQLGFTPIYDFIHEMAVSDNGNSIVIFDLNANGELKVHSIMGRESSGDSYIYRNSLPAESTVVFQVTGQTPPIKNFNTKIINNICDKFYHVRKS